MIHPEDLEGYTSTPQQLMKFLDECAVISVGNDHMLSMHRWCMKRCGEPYSRNKSMLNDFMYYGVMSTDHCTWAHCINDFDITQYLFWFKNPSDRVEFVLTWA